jgi:large subunit ribosomal protein L9
MPTMMQIVLKEDVHNLGSAGDLVKVRPGFGRNFLIPQGKAVVATASNVKEIEHQKKLIAAAKAAQAKDAQSIADKLAAIEISIERQAGEGDKLFGSVTSRDIEAALKEKGVTVDHRKIHIAEPIKTIGYHTLEIKLGSNVTGKIKVVVVPKQA